MANQHAVFIRRKWRQLLLSFDKIYERRSRTELQAVSETYLAEIWLYISSFLVKRIYKYQKIKLCLKHFPSKNQIKFKSAPPLIQIYKSNNIQNNIISLLIEFTFWLTTFRVTTFYNEVNHYFIFSNTFVK